MSRAAPPALTLGVLVSGRGSNLRAIIEAIRRGDLAAQMGVIISSKKDAAALDHAAGYPTCFVDPARYSDRREYDAVLVETLRNHGVDLVVLAGYMRLVTPTLIAPYQNRIINIHPSLLPAFPGLHAQRQALAHGVKVSGCTVHFVDEEMDHGPIIAQTAVTVREDDTEASLSARILVEEHRLLPAVIARYAEGELRIEGRRVAVGASL